MSAIITCCNVCSWFDKLFSYLPPHPSHFILSVAWEDTKNWAVPFQRVRMVSRENLQHTWLSSSCSINYQLSQKWMNRLQKWRTLTKSRDKLKQWPRASEGVKYENGHIKCKLWRKKKGFSSFPTRASQNMHNIDILPLWQVIRIMSFSSSSAGFKEITFSMLQM